MDSQVSLELIELTFKSQQLESLTKYKAEGIEHTYANLCGGLEACAKCGLFPTGKVTNLKANIVCVALHVKNLHQCLFVWMCAVVDRSVVQCLRYFSDFRIRKY